MQPYLDQRNRTGCKGPPRPRTPGNTGPRPLLSTGAATDPDGAAATCTFAAVRPATVKVTDGSLATFAADGMVRAAPRLSIPAATCAARTAAVGWEALLPREDCCGGEVGIAAWPF